MTLDSNIYVSTGCLPGIQRLDLRIAQYIQHGLMNIELGAGVSVEGDIILQLKKYKANYLVHNYFPPPKNKFILNLASNDEIICEKSINLVSEALMICSSLKIPFYSVHAGFAADPIFGKNGFIFPKCCSPYDITMATNRFINTLAYLLDKAKSLGIQLLVENNVCSANLRGKLLLQTPDEFSELIQSLPNSNLGILLDLGHLIVSAHTLGFKYLDFIDQTAPYIKAVHVHENNGKEDEHRPIVPGSKMLNVLHSSELLNLPIIIESKYQNISGLCNQVDYIKNELI